MGEEEVMQAMRARLGLVKGLKVPIGRLHATLGLDTSKNFGEKGDRDCDHEHNKNKKSKANKRKNKKHKVVLVCLISDVPFVHVIACGRRGP